MEALQNVRLGKRKTTARRATGGSQRPPQPATGGSSSTSEIPNIFHDNLQVQRYELF